MAVLEELVSKLGFEVEGLGKLKAAAKQFDATKKAVIASSNPLKAAGASAGVAAVGVGKLGDQSKKSSRSVLLLSSAMTRVRGTARAAGGILKSILAMLLRFAGVAMGAVAGIAAIGAAFVIAGSKAALARREFAMTAKTLGTNAQSLETTGNLFKYLGLGDDGAKDAEKAIKSVNEVLKTIRAGGEEAKEAQKEFAGLGIDQSFKLDPKTGKMRDAAAVLLDVVLAYKQLNEEAAGYRKQADALGTKTPKKAAALRAKALEKERRSEKIAEKTGIEGKLKVALDDKSSKQLSDIAARASSEQPTPSNASEARQKTVADQAADAGLKTEAIINGTKERLVELGQALAVHVLPGVNSFLDSVLKFGKASGLIKETVGERDVRLEQERESRRASGFGGTRDETPQQRRNRTQRELIEKQDAEYKRRNALPARDKDTSPAPPQSWLNWMKTYVSPETNAAKMGKSAEAKTDSRSYSDIGNDHRTQSVTVHQVLQQDAAAIAAAAKNAVLGAISTKGANTSTGALTAP